jgi:hypothetical protein
MMRHLLPVQTTPASHRPGWCSRRVWRNMPVFCRLAWMAWRRSDHFDWRADVWHRREHLRLHGLLKPEAGPAPSPGSKGSRKWSYGHHQGRKPRYKDIARASARYGPACQYVPDCQAELPRGRTHGVDRPGRALPTRGRQPASDAQLKFEAALDIYSYALYGQ